MRKHSLLFILIAAFAALLVACGGSGDDQPEITTGESGLPDLGGREVTVAVENAYLPFNYISLATGEPGGWDYDAWDAICELLNCVPVYVEAAWEGMIQAVANGQYDAAADGITITPDRAQIVDFSDGYISIEQRLLGVKSPAGLIAGIVGQKEDFHHTILKEAHFIRTGL